MNNPRLKRLEPKTNKVYRIEQDMYLTPEERELTKKTLEKRLNRDTILLLVILETGCRPQEALNLLKSDLLGTDKDAVTGVESGIIHITGLKGSNDRDLVVFKTLYKALEGLEADSQGFIFHIKYRRLVDLWSLYRPVKKSLKAMRHGYAVELYKNTTDIRLVQLALGHKSITNTLVYAHLVDFAKKLREGLRIC